MSRVSEVFKRTARESRMAFMPFVTAGDPNVETTAAVLTALGDAGVDLIELGFPYSDPIADGPVIQASYTRALNHGLKVPDIFRMMSSLRGNALPPVLAMVSFAIIFRHGLRAFVEQAAAAGFAGLIVPDLPADESGELSEVSRRHNLDLVPLIAPTTSPQRADAILKVASGFVYCISVAGTTGARTELPVELTQQLRSLRQTTALPLAVGFGIGSPDQVASLAGAADGVIVGSALVRRLAGTSSPSAAATAASEFAAAMVAAARLVKPTPWL
jgi:tryptophan synthase alpha chain